MKIEGLEHFDYSPLLRQLFDMAKNWMEGVTRLKVRDKEERTLQILSKTIGRNDGFVVNVLSVNRSVLSTFYAKVQPPSMDTVLMHHVLKNAKCGPDTFFIPMLQMSDSLYHGVITEKVADWHMVSTLKPAERIEFFAERDRLLSTTFLLNVLIELGRFGNIPNNGDNWGFIDILHDSTYYPDISIVDFSRGRTRYDRRFENEERFRKFWTECLQYLVNKWQTEWSPADADLAALYSTLRREEAIAEQAERLPFLQSSDAFTSLLQSACDETALWLHETIQRARYNIYNPDAAPHQFSAVSGAGDGENILVPFRHVPRPNTAGLSSSYQTAVTEYLRIVEEWNVSLQALHKWFPFPVADSGDSYNSGRYDLYCLSMENNGCEGDMGVETEWNEQFGEYASVSADVSDEVISASDVGILGDPGIPYTSMLTRLRPSDVTAYTSMYTVIKGPAPFEHYEARVISEIDNYYYRDRTLSMEGNVVIGDVGKDTEQNAKYGDNTTSGVDEKLIARTDTAYRGMDKSAVALEGDADIRSDTSWTTVDESVAVPESGATGDNIVIGDLHEPDVAITTSRKKRRYLWRPHGGKN